MIYIQIAENDNAIGFVALAKSGSSVLCLPENIYGVSSEHLTLLKRKHILSKDWKATPFVYQNPHDLTMTKYEIYLPLKYNDGTGIQPEKLQEIQQQLLAVFGAMNVSSLSAPFQGTWRYAGVEFVDDIIRI